MSYQQPTSDSPAWVTAGSDALLAVDSRVAGVSRKFLVLLSLLSFVPLLGFLFSMLFLPFLAVVAALLLRRRTKIKRLPRTFYTEEGLRIARGNLAACALAGGLALLGGGGQLAVVLMQIAHRA